MIRYAVTLGLATLACALLGGCGNPCDDLAKVCADCVDKTYGASCDAVVARDNASLCSSDVPVFRAACPVPLTTSSSTASGSAGGQAGQGGGN